ncbi:MAG: hypothetical protein AAGC60_14700 [Acidobacteriota bacterium]
MSRQTSRPPTLRHRTAWRTFFALAGLLSVGGGVAGMLGLVARPEALGMAPPLYPFAFELVFLAVLVFGLGYFLLAAAPERNRDIAWLGLTSKLGGLIISLRALDSGQLPASSWAQPLVADLPWAIGFALFLWLTRGDPDETND